MLLECIIIEQNTDLIKKNQRGRVVLTAAWFIINEKVTVFNMIEWLITTTDMYDRTQVRFYFLLLNYWALLQMFLIFLSLWLDDR